MSYHHVCNLFLSIIVIYIAKIAHNYRSKRRKKKNRTTTIKCTCTHLSTLNIATIYFSSLIGYVKDNTYTHTHTHALALPVVLISIDIKQCARNYVKMVAVVVIFGCISTLVSLATLAEANQIDEKKKRGECLPAKCQKSGSLYFVYDAMYYTLSVFPL